MTDTNLIKRLKAYFKTLDKCEGYGDRIHTINDVPLLRTDVEEVIKALTSMEKERDLMRTHLQTVCDAWIGGSVPKEIVAGRKALKVKS